MLNIDFTDRLLATLPGVNRNQVVKFNNSWVQIGQNGNNTEFLVVYRAMVHKVQDQGAWAFAVPPPQFAGQPGTPWGSGWGAPTGAATLEAQVPDGRGGRYFDGVGVAQVTLDATNLGNPAAAFNVVHDQILLNTDGFEDPRIFEANGRYFIHSHRYQPDSLRGAPGPQHRVYRGYAPERLPWTPGDITTPQRSLFVKVTELVIREGRAWTGPEFFYGSNVSGHFEKNYGFFLDGDTLCAVYGVAPNNRPFTMLRAIRGLGGQAVHDFPRGNRFIAEEFQPNTDPATDNARDCFLRLQRYYENYVPGPECVVFSSSGPMIWNDDLNRWQGVGHVKVRHDRLFPYIRCLSQAACTIGQAIHYPNAPATATLAYQALINDDDYVEAIGAQLLAHPDDARPQTAAYLNAVTGGNMAPADVSERDRNIFIWAIRGDFLRGSLASRVAQAYAMNNVMPWQGAELENPRAGGDNRVILHPQCFYFSFFFEIEAESYRLNRFSNAFLVYDQNNVAFLQFASNLARAADNYLMSFGENDNRAKLFQLTSAEYNGRLQHDATNFNPADYVFSRLNLAETVLV